MRFAMWPRAAGTWRDILDECRYTESIGWDGIWFSDHFMPNAADVSGPVNEAWTMVAALAAAVPRVRIGTLVSGNTYRHPAVLAKMAAGIDQISGGRFVLGLGAGWQENEHTAYGIPFYTVGGRLRRLEEACQVINGLFENERTTFAGRYYQLSEAPLEPKPVQRPLPLLIGGGGEQKTLRIAARYANEWNVWGTPEVLRHKGAILDRHCAEIGRNPADISRSAVALLALSDDAAVVERARGTGRPVIAGNPGEVKQQISDYISAGVNEIIIPDFNLGSLDRKKQTYARFIDEVASEFRPPAV
jgi:F420-dependent oxidoreductase-like protein